MGEANENSKVMPFVFVGKMGYLYTFARAHVWALTISHNPSAMSCIYTERRS